MKNKQIGIGEDGFIEESADQKLYAHYYLYTQLKSLEYSNEQIAIQLFCSIEDLEKLKATFE